MVATVTDNGSKQVPKVSFGPKPNVVVVVVVVVVWWVVVVVVVVAVTKPYPPNRKRVAGLGVLDLSVSTTQYKRVVVVVKNIVHLILLAICFCCCCRRHLVLALIFLSSLSLWNEWVLGLC